MDSDKSIIEMQDISKDKTKKESNAGDSDSYKQLDEDSKIPVNTEISIEFTHDEKVDLPEERLVGTDNNKMMIAMGIKLMLLQTVILSIFIIGFVFGLSIAVVGATLLSYPTSTNMIILGSIFAFSSAIILLGGSIYTLIQYYKNRHLFYSPKN